MLSKTKTKIYYLLPGSYFLLNLALFSSILKQHVEYNKWACESITCKLSFTETVLFSRYLKGCFAGLPKNKHQNTNSVSENYNNKHWL